MLRKALQALKSSPSFYWGFFFRIYAAQRFPQLIAFYRKKLTKRWDRIPRATPNQAALSRCYITSIPNVRAGIGHTLSEYIAGRIWARKLGISYAHCELTEPWESMLNFQGKAPALSEIKKSKIRSFKMPFFPSDPAQVDFDEILGKCSHQAETGPVCFILADGQNAFDIAYPSLELRKLYQGGSDFKKRMDLRVEGKVNVSVHVRRRNKADLLNPSVHDVNGLAYKARYLEGDYFLNLCRIIEEALGEDRVHFNLFSQGDPEAFCDFTELKNIRLCLDTDQYETFHNLTLSEILIVSPSSFSFKAGMLCSGLKLARHPWWHEIPDDEEWIRVGEAPHQDRKRIIARIQNHVGID